MITLYNYEKQEDGSWTRSPSEFLEKRSISAMKGTPQAMVEASIQNARYDFYLPLARAEDAWFELNTQIQPLVDQAHQLLEGLRKIDEEDEVARRPFHYPLTMIFGAGHNDITINSEGYPGSQLYEINEGIRKLEEKYPWLGDFDKKPVFTPADTTKEIKKEIIRNVRNRTVRNAEDTIADLSKMNSLLLSFVSAIYGTLSVGAKAKIPATTRAVIDHAVTEFAKIETRGDQQLAEEGTALIDKLFQREVKIANIISETKLSVKAD